MKNDKVPPGTKRSSKWPALRKKFLKGKVCAVCGGTRKLEAHHIRPFHLFPELELSPRNLIALCEGNKDLNCHIVAGHNFEFRSYNLFVKVDAARIRRRIKNRP